MADLQYPHYISHHLGSDLHDCATYDRNATIATGNVITVEPGVYVPTSSDFPAHFHGLGVRIEVRQGDDSRAYNRTKSLSRSEVQSSYPPMRRKKSSTLRAPVRGYWNRDALYHRFLEFEVTPLTPLNPLEVFRTLLPTRAFADQDLFACCTPRCLASCLPVPSCRRLPLRHVGSAVRSHQQAWKARLASILVGSARRTGVSYI